jgi:hypothetical protein
MEPETSAWQYDVPEADPPAVETPVVHRPIFVDSTGRRTRVARAVAYVGATVCIAMLVLVGVSVLAGQRTPMLELPLLGGTANASTPAESTLSLAGPVAAVGAADAAAARPTGLLQVRKTPPVVRSHTAAAPVSVAPQARRAPVVPVVPGPVVAPVRAPAPAAPPTTAPPVVPPVTTPPATPEGEPAPPPTTVPPTAEPPATTTPGTTVPAPTSGDAAPA